LGKGALRPFVLLTSSFYKFYFQIIPHIIDMNNVNITHILKP
jgi:hypothetical protein